MEIFVARENVRHFRRELENGVEQPKREILLRLLVGEENQLGFTREQMARLDRHIGRLSELMARQVELVDGFTLRDNAAGSRHAELVLATMNDIMATYIEHRHKISATLADGPA